MKQEHSAGAVILATIRNRPHVLLITDMNGNLTFPKGFVEKGEDPKSTAVRETEEETGAKGLVFRSVLSPISYTYTRGGLIRKTVNYFLFTADPSAQEFKPQKEEGISDVRWVDAHEAKRTIGYPMTNLGVLDEALERMERPL